MADVGSWGALTLRGALTVCAHPQEAANERKNFMKQKEMLRMKNEKLSDLEEEAQQRAQYLLQRANTMRMEQEDEIKKLNEVGAGAGWVG